MAISEGYKHNFETMKRAFEAGDVCLMEVKRRADGALVACVCAVEEEGSSYTMVPLAIMCEGNPYEDFLPPGNY